jgi:hypothetical protein
MVAQDPMTTLSAVRGHMTVSLGTTRAVLAACAAFAAVALIPVARAQTTTARPPASSLARPTSAPKAPNVDGFLQRWLILEPLPIGAQLTQTAVRAAVATDEFRSQLTTLPRDGETVKAGSSQLTWHAVDTLGYNVNLYHFAYALNKPTSNVLFSIATVVMAPRELKDVRLAIGSNAASVWWVNGKEVIGIYNDRQTVVDDGVSKRLTLKQGANVIRAAILNAGGATDFCARFLDADDRPLKGITITLSEK